MEYWRKKLKTGWNILGVSLLVCLLGLLAACSEDPADTAVSSTTSPAATAETPEPDAPASLPQVATVPTYKSVSQFPVAIIDSASAQRPAYAVVEMAGFNIAELTWQIGRYDDGCNRLVSMGVIRPDNEGSDSAFWQDGVHRENFSWPAVGHFLGDGEQGDFVFVESSGTTSGINGRYRSATGGEEVEARLLVDQTGRQLVGLESTSGERLTAVAGDTFQIFERCLESDGSIRSVPGLVLPFLEGGQLELFMEPAHTGDYFLHLTARGLENSASSTTDFPVDNDVILTDYQTYLNVEYGFQFLYPEAWQLPQEANSRIVTTDAARTTRLTIITHPDMSGRNPDDLKNQTLAQFGDVSILYEDQVSIGDTGALWSAYGYTGQNGAHTGIILTFIRDSVGYTVDLDGLQTAEAETISLMNSLARNWRFRPDIIAPRAMAWTTASFDGLEMPVKANYYQEELDNGWRRFTVGDGMSFMAVRTASLGRDDIEDQLEYWQEVIERGVANFAVGDGYTLTLDEREWSRIDFAYVGEGALTIQGFLMAAEMDDQAVIYWVEVPETRYEEQSDVFLVSLAGLR
jgi:hypothetical protein